MQGPEQLLRKASVEKLSSPEQLDMMMRVTSPMGWVALTALGFLIVAVIIWSVTFDLSVKVDGRGYMVRGEAVQEVQILTRRHDPVDRGRSGQVDRGRHGRRAKLSLPDVEARLVSAKALLAELESQTQLERRADRRRSRAACRRRSGGSSPSARQKQKLVDRGLLTSASVAAIDQQITSLQNSLAQSMIGTGDRGLRVEDKRLEVKELEAKLANDTVVRSPFGGRVVAMRAGVGQPVRPGEPLINLESSDDPMRVIGFVPLAAGKKVTCWSRRRASRPRSSRSRTSASCSARWCRSRPSRPRPRRSSASSPTTRSPGSTST